MLKRTVLVIAISLPAVQSHADSINSWGAWNAPITPPTAPVAGGGIGQAAAAVAAPNPAQASSELTRAKLGDTVRPPAPQGFVNNGNWVGYTASSTFGPTGASFITARTWEERPYSGVSWYVAGQSQSSTIPDTRIAALLAQGYVDMGGGNYVLTYTTTETFVQVGPTGGKSGTISHQILPNGERIGHSYGTPNYGGEVVQVASLDRSTSSGRKSVVFDFPALSNNFWWSSDSVTVDGVSSKFVAGQPTPLSEIAALRTGNVSATYTGSSFYHGHTVNLGVNFGNSTWTGTWSGSNIEYSNSTLKGGNNFSASGAISGNALNGGVTGTGILSGSVNATFTGPMAATLIGKTDMNIDRLGGGVVRITDVFSASVPRPIVVTGGGFNNTAGAFFELATPTPLFSDRRLIATQRFMQINGTIYPIPAGR